MPARPDATTLLRAAIAGLILACATLASIKAADELSRPMAPCESRFHCISRGAHIASQIRKSEFRIIPGPALPNAN